MDTLLNLRKEAKITQKEIADYLGISRQAYANYETGNRAPDFQTLKKLSSFFKVSVDYLLGNETPQNDDNLEEKMKIALFGGDVEVTDTMWLKVVEYAQDLKKAAKNDIYVSYKFEEKLEK